MRVDCPNCGTPYDVPEIHFADGARKVRCTECGYRWNQSSTHAHFNEGRKDAPLLDMLEPALEMARTAPPESREAETGAVPLTAAVVPSIGTGALGSSDDGLSVKAPETQPTDSDPAGVADDLVVTALEPDAAAAAFGALEEALAPTPFQHPARQFIEQASERWQWGLGVILAVVLLSMLVLGREAVVRTVPISQGLYRGLGLEPWSELRGWNLCLASTSDRAVFYDLSNASTFRRSAPGLFVIEGRQAPKRVDGPPRPISSGEDFRGEIRLVYDGAGDGQALRLGLSNRLDRRDLRVYPSCSFGSALSE